MPGQSSTASSSRPNAVGASAPPGSKPALPEVIERIGCGPAHFRFCLAGGGVYMADGAEILLITAVTKTVADDWGLDPYERGLAVTIVFIGVLLGNLICGPLGDRYGRRQLIIASYIGIFIFSILSSLVANYAGFCFWRLFVGLSFGIGQPAWNALAVEVTPRYWRIPMNALSQTLFVAGELYSSVLILSDDPDLKTLHWRRLLQLGAIPSVLFALAAAIFLLPSPSFLALHGRTEEARGVLDIMRNDNCVSGAGDVSTDFEVVPAPNVEDRMFGYQLKEIFSRYYLASTVITALTCLGLNTVYYGCLYAFPQILPQIQGGGSAGVQLLVGALWEIPGNFAGAMFGMCLPRKPVMKLYLVLITLSMLSFVVGVSMKVSAISQALYHGGYYGIKAVSCIGFVVTYQYAGEIFPTETRATGTSFCIAMGRIGAMIAPLIFETFQDWFGSYHGFFYLLCACSVINCLLIDFLPFETADMLVKDRLVQDEESGQEYGSVRDPRLGEAAKPVKDGEVSPDLDDGCTTPPQDGKTTPPEAPAP